MYSTDFRKRILRLIKEEGLSFRKASERFKLSPTTLQNWKKRLLPKPLQRGARKIDMEGLKRDVLEHPDAYHHERAKRLNVSVRCVGYALKRLGVTYKKNTETPQGVRRQTAYLPREN